MPQQQPQQQQQMQQQGQGQSQSQSQGQGHARHHMPFSTIAGAAQKGGMGHHRGRNNMNTVQGNNMHTGLGQVHKNSLVPGPQDPSLAMGLEDMSMPADKKASDPRHGGGMGSTAWAPLAQGPGAVSNSAAQQLGEPGVSHSGVAQVGLAHQRQAGRGLNPNKATNTNGGTGHNTGIHHGMGPGGKANNQRRAANNAMRGAPSFTPSTLPSAPPAGVHGPPSGENNGADEIITVHVATPSTPVENPMVTAARGSKAVSQSPEWVKQEDTSWVDKLLDTGFDAM